VERRRPGIESNPSFMKQAIALAVENVTSHGGGPFGAVVVRDGKVIAIDHFMIKEVFPIFGLPAELGAV